MDIASVMGPWCYFAKLFGYFPYGVNRNESCALTIIFTLCSAVHVYLHLTILWTSPWHGIYYKTKVGSRVEAMFNVVDTAVPVLGIFANFLLLRGAKELSAKLEEMNKLFSYIHVEFDENTTKKYSSVVLCLVIAMYITPLALIPILYFDHKTDLFSIALYMVYRQLSNISFLGSVTMLLIGLFLRVKSINICLVVKYLKGEQEENLNVYPSIISKPPNEDSEVLLNTLAKIHLLFCDCIEKFNFIFSFQVSWCAIPEVKSLKIDVLSDHVLLWDLLWISVIECLLLLRETFNWTEARCWTVLWTSMDSFSFLESPGSNWSQCFHC